MYQWAGQKVTQWLDPEMDPNSTSRPSHQTAIFTASKHTHHGTTEHGQVSSSPKISDHFQLWFEVSDSLGMEWLALLAISTDLIVQVPVFKPTFRLSSTTCYCLCLGQASVTIPWSVLLISTRDMIEIQNPHLSFWAIIF